MTYLIALIIAIALGAVIALLSFTNIGSGFSGQSDRAQAQVFAGAASQLEIALAAYDATSGIANLDTANFENDLQEAGWLRTDLQAPSFGLGDYSLVEEGDNLLLNLEVSGCTNALNDLDLEVSTISCETEGETSTLTATVY